MAAENYGEELKAVEELLATMPEGEERGELLALRADLRRMLQMQETLHEMKNPDIYVIDKSYSDEEDPDVEIVGENRGAGAIRFLRAPKPLLGADVANPIFIDEDGRMDDRHSEVVVLSDKGSDSDEVEEIAPPPPVHRAPPPPAVDVSQIAAWEKHTTGFGSRMLAKFGYSKGQRLGVSKQGPAVPIKIAEEADSNVKLGLGHHYRKEISEHRHRRAQNPPADAGTRPRNRRKRRADQLELDSQLNQPKRRKVDEAKPTVFEFMNKVFSGPTDRAPEASVSYKGLSRRDLEKQLRYLQDDYNKAYVETQRLELALNRHLHDQTVADRVGSELARLRQVMHRLATEQKQIQTRLEMKDKKTKLF